MIRGILEAEGGVMNEKIQELLQQVEKRGGNVHLSSQLPDPVAESFLREVLDCADCDLHADDRHEDRTQGRKGERAH